MRPLDEVIAHTVSSIAVLDESVTTLDHASGLYLARPTIAPSPVPPFDNTAVDGYALRTASLVVDPHAPLRVTGTIAAGTDPSGLTLGIGEAIRIMTGAPLPPGTDAVVMVEDTTVEQDFVTILQPPPVGANIRRRGTDMSPGQTVFDVGTRITPAVRGVLASLGITEVTTYRRPRVGVISTGDELSDDLVLAPGKIRDSNRPALLDSVAALGAHAVDLGTCRDDLDVIRHAFAQAVATCDAVITSGGVSVGDFDYTKAVLNELSDNHITWFQVAIKPAKPYAFGLIDGTPVFGLPGNPVSALVSFELFVRPSILRLFGSSQLYRPHLRATTTVDLHHTPDGKLHLVRARLEPSEDRERGLIVTPQGHQSSHVLTGLANSNALILVPDGATIPAGEPVDVMLIGELEAPVFSSPMPALGTDAERASTR